MQLTDKQIKRILNAAGALAQEAKHHKLPRAVTDNLTELEAATSVEPEGMTYDKYRRLLGSSCSLRHFTQDNRELI